MQMVSGSRGDRIGRSLESKCLVLALAPRPSLVWKEQQVGGGPQGPSPLPPPWLRPALYKTRRKDKLPLGSFQLQRPLGRHNNPETQCGQRCPWLPPSVTPGGRSWDTGVDSPGLVTPGGPGTGVD